MNFQMKTKKVKMDLICPMGHMSDVCVFSSFSIMFLFPNEDDDDVCDTLNKIQIVIQNSCLQSFLSDFD